ncbi:MAG: SpoIIE family protein phosphatase [Leptospira sp.]|nr:SpoIIE family protein phosphatase [Leptospira sp.]
MEKQLKVLFIEDSEDDADLLARLLRKAGYQLSSVRVDNRKALMDSLKENSFDIILADYVIPGFGGMEALKIVKAIGKDIPVILISGSIGESIAVDVMRAGAQDYIMKDNLTRLVPAIQREMQESESRMKARIVQSTLKEKEDELRLARIIQSNFFPDAAPEVPGYDIAGKSYSASETGGDYYDFIPLLDGSTGIIIADVSGHGIGSALLMTSTRAYLRAFSTAQENSGKILESTNRVLFRDIRDGKSFVTLILVRMNFEKNIFSYSSAGHPSAYLIGNRGEIKNELKSLNLPLGVDPRPDYNCSGNYNFEKDDILILITDGVSDTRSPDNHRFGIKQTIEIVNANRKKKASEIIEILYQEIEDFSGSITQEDDVTIILVKREI